VALVPGDHHVALEQRQLLLNEAENPGRALLQTIAPAQAALKPNEFDVAALPDDLHRPRPPPRPVYCFYDPDPGGPICYSSRPS
jgi:hypothetical protein